MTDKLPNFTTFEVAGCRRRCDGDSVEPFVSDEEARFYSVYGVNPNSDTPAEHIADRTTKEEAMALAKGLARSTADIDDKTFTKPQRPLMTSYGYVELGGGCCPYCRSTAIRQGDGFRQQSTTEARRELECISCGETWLEVYLLTYWVQND